MGWEARARCSLAAPAALPQGFTAPASHGQHNSPVLIAFAEDLSVPAHPSSLIPLSPSTPAQDHNAFAAEVQTLGWEMLRDKSRLLDRYIRSLINSRMLCRSRVLPAMQQCVFLSCQAGVGCRGCWWNASGPPQPLAAGTSHRNQIRFPLLWQRRA